MPVFTQSDFSDHESVMFCADAASGLKAIIAIHSTRLGPALGGCRMWNYATENEAITDALRLSKGMTYKNALAGLPLGGGKSVIIGNAKTDKTPAMVAAFAKQVNRLHGAYFMAEDVGTTLDDMELAAQHTKFVSGTAATGGDPSPYTARGCFVGIKAAVRHKLQKDSLEGVSVAIQGLGNVGWAMAEFLHDAGAKLYVADIHENVLTKAKATFGATVIDTATIHAQDVDVFAPCALGASINPNTLPDLKAPIIAGSANNQLATPADGLALFEKGILYAPDYVINAGGVICVGSYAVAWEVAQINEKVDAIEATLDSIFAESKERHAPPEHVADAQAERLLQS